MKKQNGFSVGELTIVMLIITALIGSSVPLFYYLRFTSREAKMRETIDQISASIATQHFQEILSDADFYPASLDDNEFPAPCNRCFEEVLKKGIHDPLWFKFSFWEYGYSLNGNFGALDKYLEKRDRRIIYNPQEGSLSVKKY